MKFGLNLVIRGEEWGEFTHLPGQRFYDFGEIRNEIQRDTDKVSGTNKAISRQTINLKIYSPHVVNLTLVDLPGIVKVPFEGQPEDIEEQIRSLCYDFISKPNAIILAVSAANQDLANSDGLKMARSVDPEGKRTIGVLTKVDIMDHGTDCCEVLNMNNHSYPLRRGYIAVVNRSQLDIANNITIRSGLDKEIAFFQSHVKYRNFLEKCGTSTLAKTLNQTLVQIIREGLPGIRDSISKMLTDVQSKISSLGISVADQNSESKGSIILKMVSQFAKNIHDSLEGKSNPSHLLSESELYGGARINYIV